MFEIVDTPSSVDDETWERRVPELRSALLDAQYEALRQARFGTIVIVNGVDGAGKGETVQMLSEWMDPRHLRAHALVPPTDEELERPPMWQFWRLLPAKGRISVLFGSWYTDIIAAKESGDVPDGVLGARLSEVRRFEKMLVDEGAVLLKLWFHLSKKGQKRRIEDLERSKKTRWRITKDVWRRYGQYDRYRTAAELVVEATHVAGAPWRLVNGENERHRDLVVAEALLDALNEANARPTPPAPAAPKVPKKRAAAPNIDGVDLTAKLEDDDYGRELARWQRELGLLTRKKRFRRVSPVIVFEGMDAAGKGGAIRRLVAALDPRHVEVVPIAAPSDEERAHPYLWRFWRHAPRDGKVVIFDRSWYGRVLVERVEGYCAEADWRRAYEEIVDFERQLVESGDVVVKLWLQTSSEEQLRRFKAREETPYKRFKIGPDDWRNREKWPLYRIAADEMIARTSTPDAPWTVISAEDKKHARVEVLKTVVEAIRRAL